MSDSGDVLKRKKLSSENKKKHLEGEDDNPSGGDREKQLPDDSTELHSEIVYFNSLLGKLSKYTGETGSVIVFAVDLDGTIVFSNPVDGDNGNTFSVFKQRQKKLLGIFGDWVEKQERFILIYNTARNFLVDKIREALQQEGIPLPTFLIFENGYKLRMNRKLPSCLSSEQAIYDWIEEYNDHYCKDLLSLHSPGSSENPINSTLQLL